MGVEPCDAGERKKAELVLEGMAPTNALKWRSFASTGFFPPEERRVAEGRDVSGYGSRLKTLIARLL